MIQIPCRCGTTKKNFRVNIGDFYIDECCEKAGYDHAGNREGEAPIVLKEKEVAAPPPPPAPPKPSPDEEAKKAKKEALAKERAGELAKRAEVRKKRSDELKAQSDAQLAKQEKIEDKK